MATSRALSPGQHTEDVDLMHLLASKAAAGVAVRILLGHQVPVRAAVVGVVVLEALKVRAGCAPVFPEDALGQR